jgi:RsiW-degrading membrane proteinase PrsW (M82 family)
MSQKAEFLFEARRRPRGDASIARRWFLPPWTSLVLALVATLALAGCSPHLAGTNDAALEYEVDADPATGRPLDAESAAVRAKARLSAAQISADVDPTPDGRHIRVVVDADATGAVDALVSWRGGLTASRVGSSTGTGVPLAELPLATVDTALHGRALALTFPAHARDTLVALAASDPHERVTLSRGATRLATLDVRDSLVTPLVLGFGDDVTAYARAARNRSLLESPMLPPMHRTDAVRLPTDRALAAGCAILPFALSFAWLGFVRRFDRARPEPIWLVVATFALGGLSTIPAGLAEMAYAAATPWLDPSVMTLGGQAWALPIAIAVFTLVVGVTEEGAKFLGAWSLARHRHEFDEPIDGIIYGSAAALGFAAVENVKYFAVGRMSGMVIAVRAFVTVPAHMFFGALWGYALGRQLVSRKASVLPLFALAALAHGSFDALLSTDGMQLTSTVLILGLAVAFVAMLRVALRYGVVAARASWPGAAPPTEPMPGGELARTYFRVGSSRTFFASAAGLIVCSFALTVVGGAYEYLHHRVGIVFVGLSTVLLALFGLSAYGASETIPLDVAIDAQGVTFGGARTPWRAVVNLDVEVNGKRARVLLRTTESVVRLGPTSIEKAQAIAASIRAAHAVV